MLFQYKSIQHLTAKQKCTLDWNFHSDIYCSNPKSELPCFIYDLQSQCTGQKNANYREESISIRMVSQNNKCLLINKFGAFLDWCPWQHCQLETEDLEKQTNCSPVTSSKMNSTSIDCHLTSAISYLVTNQILNWISFSRLVIAWTKAATLNVIKTLYVWVWFHLTMTGSLGSDRKTWFPNVFPHLTSLL